MTPPIGISQITLRASTGDNIIVPDGLELFFDYSASTVGGGTVADLSGNNNDGTINGSPTLVDGPVGDALDFDDANGDYISIPHDPSLDVQNGDFSVVGWVELDETIDANSANVHTVFQKKPRTGVFDEQSGYQLEITGPARSNNPNQVNLAFGDGSSVFYAGTPSQLETGARYLLIGTYDSDNKELKVFINAAEHGNNTVANAPVDNDAPLQIGAHFDGGGSVDTLLDMVGDEARVYSRDLSKTQSDINRLYRQGIAGGISYVPVFQEEVLSNHTDPLAVYESGRSPPYLLAANDAANDTTPLYESSDLSSWTQISADITPSFTDNAGSNLQDYVYVDGTYYVYGSSSETDINLFSGPSLDNLTNEGVVLSGKYDCGAFYEDGTYYLFTEGDDEVSGEPCTNDIALFTSSNPDGPWTQQPDPIDVNDRAWHTGGPDIEKFGGSYYMFMDRSITHPEYYLALAKSDDLLNWTIIDDCITAYKGGDMEVLDDGSGFPLPAFTETTGNDESGIGRWELHEIV